MEQQSPLAAGTAWPIPWGAAWVGALTALAVGLIIGLLGAGAGPFLLRSNNGRLDRYPKEYAADAKGFVEREARRMAGVHRNWLPLKITWTVLLVIGVGFAFYGASPTWKGVGLGIIVIGVIGLISDYLFKAANRRMFPWSLA